MKFLADKPLVVPIDFSDESAQAVDEAIAITDDASQIHVVHVLPQISPSEPGVLWDTLSDPARSQHAEDALRERFSSASYAEINFAVRFGDPGAEIAKFAEENGAGLIVMPSQGRGGLKRLLIGSVAERVCRLAHCAVLVLRQ